MILTLQAPSYFEFVPCIGVYGNKGYVLCEVKNPLLGQWQLWYGEFNPDNPSGTISWQIASCICNK